MAKNFKNNGVWDNVIEGVWSGITFGGQLIIGSIWAVLDLISLLALVITSPLWFTLLVIANPERAAYGLNHRSERDFGFRPEWLDWWLTVTRNVFIYYAMRWMWTPVIALLPMKYRKEFIIHGNKMLGDYSVKTQIKYFKTFDDEGKKNLIAHGYLSAEARATIWQDKYERDNWVDSDLQLTKSQVEDLIAERGSALLRRYFRRNTPNKEMINFLLIKANHGFGNAMEALLELIRTQRPNRELVGKLLSVKSSDFQQKVRDIIDAYADLDAVEFSVSSLPGGDMSDEEKHSIIMSRWNSFCIGKKNISTAAQKKMSADQYRSFQATGHTLDYPALQHLCLTVQNESYLRDILSIEYESIDENIVTALKSEYWRYSLYLAVKQEREKKA